MEARISKLEERITGLEEFAADAKLRLTRIEAHLDQITSRVDQTVRDVNEVRVAMHKGFADMTKWIIGTAMAMSAAGIVVMTFVLNYATPRPAPTATPPAAIVVYAQPPPGSAPSPAGPPQAPTGRE
jgi:uncharacterized coiled-coil protein SlyX